MNRHALDRLEFPRVLEQLARHAETEAGRALVRALVPDSDPSALTESQELYRRVTAAPAVRRLSLSGAVDLGPQLERVGKGGVLAPTELYQLGVTIRRGEEVLAALDQEGDEVLAAHFGRFFAPRGLRAAIDRTVTEEGAIKDSASPELAEIRRRIHHLEAEIDQVFERLLRSPAFQQYLQEPLITLRNGRRVVPVKHHFRNSVPGLVHDQSGSGQTVFVEPMAVVERQNRIQALRGEEREEIERILRRLAQDVATVRDALEAMNRSLIRLDLLLAKARWGEEVGGVLPSLGGDVLVLREARHPLLAAPVPISLTLGGDKPVLVVTGPNTGGKTVSLKCTGLMVLLALAGCPVPAAADTRVPYFRDVMADIGDEQSLEQNLSTFSGHLRQLIPMVAASGPGVLLLVDEIGAGTDPEEGAALAVAVLEHFLATGATVMVTTHFSRVKLMAYHDPRVENAQVEFDREALVPTYRLIMGQPGSSQALYIAERLGLAAPVVARARELLGGGETAVEQVIERLNAVERRLREEEAALAAERDRLERRTEELQEAQAAFERRRTVERQRERERWQEALRAIRREAEAAIQAVREAEREEREQAIQALRDTLNRFDWEPPGASEPAGVVHPAGAPAVRAGDWVTGGRLPEAAEVLAVDGEEALVAVGAVKLRLPVRELTPVKRPPAATPRRASAAGAPRRTVPLECDLRGLTVAEALDTLDRYLDDAVVAGLPMARIIHGKGTGALRRAVQELLREHPAVTGFRLGEAGEGGDGVTVVRFDGGSG